MLEKRIVLLFWVCLIGQMLVAQDLYRVQENGRFGYIDEKGTKVIPCIYVNAGEFREGLAPVRLPKGLFGYINTKGTWAIKPQYDYAREFSEGLAVVFLNRKPQVINRKNQQPFKNDSYKEIVDLADISDFKNGLSTIKSLQYHIYGKRKLFTGAKYYGIMNNKGELLTSTIEREATLNERYINIKSEGVLDQNGRWVVKRNENDRNFKVSSIGQEYSEVKKEHIYYDTLTKTVYDSFFIFNPKGKLIFKFRKESDSYHGKLEMIKEGYICVLPNNDGKHGAILLNFNGDTILNNNGLVKFSHFSNNRFFAKLKHQSYNREYDKYVMFDYFGKKVSSDTFNFIAQPGFVNNKAFVILRDYYLEGSYTRERFQYTFIDTLGNYLQEKKEIEVKHLEGYNNPLEFYITDTNDPNFKYFENILYSKHFRIINGIEKKKSNKNAYKIFHGHSYYEKFAYLNKNDSIIWLKSLEGTNNFDSLDIDKLYNARMSFEHEIPNLLELPKHIPIYQDSTYFYVDVNTIDSSESFQPIAFRTYFINNKKKKFSYNSLGVIHIQAKKENGEWESITYQPRAFCGVGEGPRTIDENQIFSLHTPIFTGSKKTKFRLYSYGAVSNEYDSRFNPAQLYNVEDND